LVPAPPGCLPPAGTSTLYRRRYPPPKQPYHTVHFSGGRSNIDQDGSFSTGVTIFVFDDVNNSLGVNGSAYILAQAADAFTLPERTFTRFTSQLRDHGVAANYEYIDRSVPEAVIRCFVALIEDVQKKQVITVICEAPVEDFDAMMVTLRPMLARIEVE